MLKNNTLSSSIRPSGMQTRNLCSVREELCQILRDSVTRLANLHNSQSADSLACVLVTEELKSHLK